MNGYDINTRHYRHYNGMTLCKSCNDAERSIYEVTRLPLREKWAMVKESGSKIICDHCNGRFGSYCAEVRPVSGRAC